jgi:hypothetical protein
LLPEDFLLHVYPDVCVAPQQLLSTHAAKLIHSTPQRFWEMYKLLILVEITVNLAQDETPGECGESTTVRLISINGFDKTYYALIEKVFYINTAAVKIESYGFDKRQMRQDEPVACFSRLFKGEGPLFFCRKQNDSGDITGENRIKSIRLRVFTVHFHDSLLSADKGEVT